MMQDSHIFNIKFVQTVEKYNVLYDNTLQEYSNRHIQEKAWIEVGKEMNETSSACKERWKNIRSAFTRHLRQKPSSGSGPKKNYYLADYLQFLIQFCKPRQINSNIPSPTSIIYETNLNEEDLQNGEHSEDEENEHITQDTIMDDTTPATSTTEEAYTPKVSVKKRKEMDPLEKCSVDYCTYKKRNDIGNVDDPDLLFLKSLLPDLHRMSNFQKHEFKCKILKIIGEILYTPKANDP